MENPAWSTSTSEIVAVEPNPEMRSVLARETANKKVKVSAVDGTFENIEVPDAWADVIIMATVRFLCSASFVSGSFNLLSSCAVLSLVPGP